MPQCILIEAHLKHLDAIDCCDVGGGFRGASIGLPWCQGRLSCSSSRLVCTVQVCFGYIILRFFIISIICMIFKYLLFFFPSVSCSFVIFYYISQLYFFSILYIFYLMIYPKLLFRFFFIRFEVNHFGCNSWLDYFI